MIFEIDTTSSIPIYVQIVDQVKRAIAVGILLPGDPLPSLREMAASLRVNPLTVARGYRELEARQIVTTEHGRGTFICARVHDLGDGYRREMLVKAIDRMLAEAYQLTASPDEVRTTLEERLQLSLQETEPKTHSTPEPSAKKEQETDG